MGEAVIIRRYDNDVMQGLIKVHTTNGATIKATNENQKIISKVASFSTDIGVLELVLDFGDWIIECIDTPSGESIQKKEICIDQVSEYDLYLKPYRLYTVAMDMSDSNYGVCTYEDNADGFEPLIVDIGSLAANSCNYGSWKTVLDEIIGVKPCLLNQDGSVYCYLNPNDYTKDISGSSVSRYSWDKKNTMIEFNKVWYKYWVEDEILRFSISEGDRSDEGYITTAFKSAKDNTTVKDHLYYGAYLPKKEGSYPLCSMPYSDYYGVDSVYPIDLVSLYTAIGDGYNIESWVTRCYVLGLCLLVTKKMNVCSSLGYCCNSSYIDAGVMDQMGLFAGYHAGGNHKVFGIENFFGGLQTITSGIFKDSEYKFRATSNHNDLHCTGDFEYIPNEYTHDGHQYDGEYAMKMGVILNGSAVVPYYCQADRYIGFGSTTGIDVTNAYSGEKYLDTGHFAYTNQDGPFCFWFNLEASGWSYEYSIGRLIYC